LGKNCLSNGIGVIVEEEMKGKVVDVVKKNDTVIGVKLIFEEKS